MRYFLKVAVGNLTHDDVDRILDSDLLCDPLAGIVFHLK